MAAKKPPKTKPAKKAALKAIPRPAGIPGKTKPPSARKWVSLGEVPHCVAPETTAPRAARVTRVATQAAAGVPVPEIAAELGVSRQQVYKILRADDCRQICITLANRQIGLISTIFETALQAIADALTADRPDVMYLGCSVAPGGPDHYARMTAVARLCKVLTLGRPTALVPENRKPGSILVPKETFERSAEVPSDRDLAAQPTHRIQP